MIRACAPDAPASFAPLSRSFYARPVHEVARDLLGTIVVRTVADRHGAPSRLAGRIVEVEAYDGPRDLACHAAKGRTPRTEVMFGEAGHAYVYLVYGMHRCLNVVTGPVGYPAAVLIRALEPVEGVDAMDPGRAAPRLLAAGGAWAGKPWRLGVRGSESLSGPFPSRSAGGGRTRAGARRPPRRAHHRAARSGG